MRFSPNSTARSTANPFNISLVKQSLERFNGKWLIIAIFGVSLIWALSMAGVGWSNSLSLHGFRQTQTAITSYYILHGGPFLRYETPIFGYPWSIPFEFPLYQWIVAITSRTFHLQLESAGRIISELFFWLSLVTMWGILAELRVRPVYRLIFVTLTLVSPQYIYWPRTFMIESTALFFCMAYFYFMLRYIRTRKVIDASLGGVLGALGVLVKVTTFPAFALVGGLLYLYSLRHEYRDFKERRKSLNAYLPIILAVLFFFCLPVLVGWIWVHYTDQVKALNLVSDGHLTSGTLQVWNFGTLSQRFASSTWKRMLSLTIPELSGYPIVLLLPCLGLYFARHRFAPFLISIVGFLSAFLIFTNVHVIHDYYAYANGVFLIAAISWCIVGLLEGKLWHKYFGIAIFVICILSPVEVYYGRLHELQGIDGKTFGNLPSAVKEVTQPADVIVIFQNDWSAELAYYSERRALIWPGWMGSEMDATMKEAIRRLGNYKIGAAVFCHYAQTSPQLIKRVVSHLGLAPEPSFEDSTCTLYSSSKAANIGPSSETAAPQEAVGPSANAAAYGGMVDLVSCDVISGWVWNGANITEDIKVDIYVGGKSMGTVRAINHRPDLKAGTGNYGFVFAIPRSLKDGQRHPVGAKVSGSNYDIIVWEKTSSSLSCLP